MNHKNMKLLIDLQNVAGLAARERRVGRKIVLHKRGVDCRAAVCEAGVRNFPCHMNVQCREHNVHQHLRCGF